MRRSFLLLLTSTPLAFSGSPSVHNFDARLPLRFEHAPSGAGVHYVARAAAFTMLLGGRDLRFRTSAGSTAMSFEGAAPPIAVEALDPLVTRINDYTGPPSNWAEGAQCYGRVRYRKLYPGIDLVFYGQGSTLEYDAQVAPGADPSRIAFRLDPAAQPRIDASGDLRLSLPGGDLTWRKPVAYQMIDNRRVPVESSFRLRGRRVSFAVASWNHRYPLVIDPTLAFSTYVGGSQHDVARGIAVDSTGIYIAGGTNSPDLPVNGQSEFTYKGGEQFEPGDAFVAKLNPTGTSLLYITYIGGTDNDSATAITVDGSGNAYVAGFTASSDFPVTAGTAQTTFGGFGESGAFVTIGDAFVAKFDASGKRTWATYLGGKNDDGADAIVLDSAGNIFVAGATLSPNFPIKGGGAQSTYGGFGGQLFPPQSSYESFDTGDAFVAKLDPTGSQILASTVLGGSHDDFASALALDASGNVWIAGGTVSSNFPIKGAAIQSSYAGETDPGDQFIFQTGDGFLAEFTPDLKTLTYSSYIGGSRDDVVSAIAFDSTGAIYLAGGTQSTDFPKANNSYHGPVSRMGNRPNLLGDAFVAKLNPGGAGLVWSTYIGGSDDDGATGMVIDHQNNIYVAGMTNSNNFPTQAALQGSFGGSGTDLLNVVGDGFITELNTSGSVTWSTYLGGSSYDAILGMTLDSSGSIYVAGLSGSPNFPGTTAAVVQAKLKAKTDAIVAKVDVCATSGPTPTITSVKNSADYATAAFSPGEAVAIFGSNLGPNPAQGAALDASGNLATTVACVQATFDGTPAPLFYEGPAQINAIVPYEVSGKTTVNVVVTYNGTPSAPFSIKIGSAGPALYTDNYQGTGQASVWESDAQGNLTKNSASNPASPNQIIVLLGTGEGQLSPAGITGHVVPLAGPYPQIAGTVSVSIGGVTVDPANIYYKGSIPGFVEGAFQINCRIPSTVKSGNQPVIVTIGGQESQSGVTINVK